MVEITAKVEHKRESDLLSTKKSKTDQPVSESQFADHYYTKKFLDDYFKKLNLK